MTVNQRVAGSSPAGGADNQSFRKVASAAFSFLPAICQQTFDNEAKS
jgi:hypothetical protein